MRKLIRWVLCIFLLAACLSFASSLADSAFPALTVNGQTDNILLAFNEAPLIRVNVPEGATALSVEAERISTPDGSPVNPEEDPREWNEWYDRHRLCPVMEVTGKKFFDQGTWRVTASYITEDYDDGADLFQDYQWMSFASVDVNVSNWLVRMDAPSVSLASSSAAQGEWIRATLGSFQQKNEWYWYELARMDENDGSWGEWFGHADITLREGVCSTFSVPTLELDPGTYRLWLRTEAVGYEDNGTYATFTVTESSALPDGIALSAASVPVNVKSQITLRAAGADRMQVTVTQDEDPYWDYDPMQIDGDEGVWRPEFDRPGTFRMTLTAFEGENSRTAGTAVLTVTSSDRLADPAFSFFPGILAEGQDLSGTITLDDRTENASIQLNFCPEDGDWESMYNTFRETSGQGAEALSLPASIFTREGRYRLHVHANAAGIESSYKDYWLIRSNASGSGVTLKVNGGTQDVTLPSFTDAHIDIIAPTATAARVLNGDRWEYRIDPGEFSFDMGFGSGDYALVAQITTENFDRNDFRWEDLDWGEYSNAVILHAVNTNGRLDPPDVTLESDAVANGEWLRASVQGQGHGEHYWAEVRRLWRDENGFTQWERVIECGGDGANGFALPGNALAPGSYYLTVGANAAGWESAETSVPFAVTGTGASIPDAALFFRYDSILTSTDITFYACAKGADRVTVDVSWDEDLGWNNHFEADDEVGIWRFNCSQSGTYTFALSAWLDGEIVGDDSFTLTVRAPYGALDEPVVEDIPALITTETGLLCYLTSDEDASYFGFQLVYCPEDAPWEWLVDTWYQNGPANAFALQLPARAFTRPGIYRLEIHTTAVGYNGSHLNKQILVTDADLPQSLGLRVDADEIYLHQNIPVTVTAPSNVTAVRLWSSSYDRWDYRADDGRGFDWYWGFHSGGDDTLIAQGTTDPSVTAWLNDPDHDGMRDFDWGSVAWTVESAPVTVNVIKYGNLAAPQVTFPLGTNVERGQMLQLTIEPVANAYTYGVQVRRPWENGGMWLVDMDCAILPGTAASISLPTDGLEDGDYLLNIDPRRYGWQGDSREYPFTVTQGTPWTEGAVFRVSDTEVLTGEFVTCSVYAPGAEEVKWQIGDDEDRRSAYGESLTDSIVFYEEESCAVRGYARYPGEDEWTQIGDEMIIDVNAPYGHVEVEVQAPETVLISDMLTITAACDFKGTDGSVECYISPLENPPILLDAVSEYDEGGLHYITYQVEADTLGMGPCFVTAFALPGAVGYDMGRDDKKVDVTAGTLEAALTVSPNPVEIFDDVHIHLSAPGASAVALYGTANGMGWSYRTGDSLDDDQTMWWDGEYTFYGLYTTEEIDPEQEGFSWETVHWEGASNSVALTVNPPFAELEELNVSLDHSTVKRGEKLKITILNNNPGLQVSYGANLQPIDNEGYSSGYSWFAPEEDDAKTIWIETLEVEPGEYRVQVSANARGCLPVNTWIPVTITAADDGLQMTVRDRDVVTGSMLQVTGYASGAVGIRLDVSFENGTWVPEPAFFETAGDLLRTEVFSGEHPDTVVLHLTASYADGTSETLVRRITVAAPKGKVHPQIRLNSAWQPGKDLDFTVNVGDDVQYVVFVQEPGAEEAVFAQFVPTGTPVKQFLLSKDDYVFAPGKAYEIRVIAAGTGYDGGEAFLPITQSASLTVLNLPSGLQSIEEEAFAGVAAEKIVVPYGVTVIGSNAFSACPNLVELVLPEGITSFAADALGTSGPVYVYGQAGGYLETYAASVNNLVFVPVE